MENYVMRPKKEFVFVRKCCTSCFIYSSYAINVIAKSPTAFGKCFSASISGLQ